MMWSTYQLYLFINYMQDYVFTHNGASFEETAIN